MTAPRSIAATALEKERAVRSPTGAQKIVRNMCMVSVVTAENMGVPAMCRKTDETSGIDTRDRCRPSPSMSNCTPSNVRNSQNPMHRLKAVTVSAPGRLDVMGGVSDYSGGTVLQMPIAARTRVKAELSETPILSLTSVLPDRQTITFSADLRNWQQNPLQACRDACTETVSQWAAYFAGCVALLMERGAWSKDMGVSLRAESDVPLGAGVSSSAAAEVSALCALARLCSYPLAGLDLASAAQEVEHRAAGAACGIMDQATAVLGRKDHLFVLRCRPHEPLGHQPIPSGWRFIGIHSGVKHSVGGSAYSAARDAAEAALKYAQSHVRNELNYLAECTAAELASLEWKALPDPQLSRTAAEFAVSENRRCREFLALMGLASEDEDPSLMHEAGSLMLQTHRFYSDLGLGSEETDLLVNLLTDAGAANGVYGARVSGGGSGGTVAVLCDHALSPQALQSVMKAYQQRTGLQPSLIQGSSDGVLIESEEMNIPSQ
jgi:L-arabinokinase